MAQEKETGDEQTIRDRDLGGHGDGAPGRPGGSQPSRAPVQHGEAGSGRRAPTDAGAPGLRHPGEGVIDMHGDEMATGRVERPPRKRASRRSLRIAAAASATLAFALPWAALRVAPRPLAAAPQTVV